jgi:CHAD domain-containing protein
VVVQQGLWIRLEGAEALERAVAELAELFSGVRVECWEERRRFADTFDWRLHGAGLVFCRRGEEGLLCSQGDGGVVERVRLGPGVAPRFWWEFPPGRVRERLRRLLSVRALLPLLDVVTAVREHRLLNEDGKTVVRLREEVHEVVGARGSGALHRLHLVPVRGYDEELERCRRRLLESFPDARVDVSLLTQLLAVLGRTPGDYSSRPAPRLSPRDPVHRAAQEILLLFHRIMRRNEEGIVEDWDSEFLHDYRVACRRSRSVLARVKVGMPEDLAGRYREHCARLGELTNELRDLDVYLLLEEPYREALPELLREGLAPFFERLRARRAEAHRRVREALSSPEYAEEMAHWGRILERGWEDLVADREAAQEPVVEFARREIHRRFKRVLKRGTAITDASPDAALHKLRIDCKKLRYLLEVFAGLFPAERMSRLIRDLKDLQTLLGEFNDLSVQQALLRGELETLAPGSGDCVQQAAALGGLITSLHRRQKKLRGRFASAFEAFSGSGNVRIYRELFRS